MTTDAEPPDMWERGLVVLVIAASLLGPYLMRPKQRYHPSLMTTLAPWAGIVVTLAAFVLHATWNAAKVDSAIAGQTSALAEQSARLDQMIAQVAAEEQRWRELEGRIFFLCNERRRDNEEAGRVASVSPC